MDNTAQIILSLGALFAVGLLCNELGKRTAIPRVTLLLLFGALISPNVLNLVPIQVSSLFPYISQIALSMIGFLLGEHFVYTTLQHSGKIIWSITLSQCLCASLAVFTLLILFNTPVVLALLLAGIATATDPAAIVDVIRENKITSELSNILLKVVAIDDAVGILIFSLCLALAQFIDGNYTSHIIYYALKELLGAVLIGCMLGWPMAKLTGRLAKGEPMLIEALAFVLLCSGIALWFHTSYLLACMVLGAVVANFASHHEYPFHAIDGISTPLLITFFIMAGFQLDILQLPLIGSLGLMYVVARSVGKISGAYLGAKFAGADNSISRGVGWCLLPQAGVALGMTLMAAEAFPEHSGILLSLVVSVTIIFELIGPVLTQKTLIHNTLEENN